MHSRINPFENLLHPICGYRHSVWSVICGSFAHSAIESHMSDDVIYIPCKHQATIWTMSSVNHSMNNTVFVQLCPQLESVHHPILTKQSAPRWKIIVPWNYCDVINVTRQENSGIHIIEAVNPDVCIWSNSWAPLKYLPFLFYSLWHIKLTVRQWEDDGVLLRWH